MKKSIYLFSKTPCEGVVHIPILAIEFLHVSLELSQYDALVITSKQALFALEKYNPRWKNIPIIAISKPTADKAQSMGAKLLHVGEGYGKDLCKIIQAHFSHLKLCYARAETIVTDFASQLREEGVAIDDPIVYKTTCNDDLAPLKIEDNAVLIFTSPSSIKCFLKQNSFKESNTIVVIGTTTQKALPLHVKSLIAMKPTVEECIKRAQSLSL
ncbi:MAG: uroporphyrinogen-III synthase [Campylobacterota bacterium]|nr:uroporphyrinogen-III synthase [Campylobacterota bacterium]